MADKPARNGRRESRPSFQFYPQDFLASDSVAQMTHAEVGVFILLLCRAWVGPGLPTELARVARLVGLPEKKLRDLWSGPLGACWVEVDGRLINPRQERERALAEEKTARRAEAGSRGGKAKADAQQTCSNARGVASTLLEQSDSKGDGTGRDGMGWDSEEGVQGEDPPPPPAKPTPLARAIAKCLSPPDPRVVAAAREWDEHTRDKTAEARGGANLVLSERAWLVQLMQAERDPVAWVARVQENLTANAGRLQDAPKRGATTGPNADRTPRQRDQARAHQQGKDLEAFLEQALSNQPTQPLRLNGGAA